MKYLAMIGMCALLAACGSTGTGGGGSRLKTGGGQQAKPKPEAVRGVTSTVIGMREVLKAKVGEKDVVAVLQWREYSAKRDSSVGKWYGDMGTPPPKFVCDSLMVSIDGRGLVIPSSKTRYLASQWMNGTKSLGLLKQGSNLTLFVNLGDGAESWVASYTVNPNAGALVDHGIHDGPEFHNSVIGP